MTTATKEKRGLLDLASDLTGFVKKHGWISIYDTESDALSVTVPKLSKDARIQYFDKEVAFYITKGKKIEGLFLEYFKTNFVKHHQELKPIMKDLEKKVGGSVLIKLDQEKVEKIAPDLEEAIKSSLAERFGLNLKT